MTAVNALYDLVEYMSIEMLRWIRAADVPQEAKARLMDTLYSGVDEADVPEQLRRIAEVVAALDKLESEER